MHTINQDVLLFKFLIKAALREMVSGKTRRTEKTYL